jgi:hypothetical protein
MLTPELIELIHREIDGESTPESSAAFRLLVDRDPEARALAAELREIAALLGKVEQRAPSPQLRNAIVAVLPPTRASPETTRVWMSPYSLLRWSSFQLRTAKLLMEDLMTTKRALLIGSTAVAVVAIIAVAVTGYPPTGRESGTIGGLSTGPSDPIGGVQQASRYRNRTVTERDVTLANPEIQAIFQNHQVLALVKSDVFRDAMQNDAFRGLQSSEAFRKLMNSDAFRELLNSEAYRKLLNSEAYRDLLNSEAYRDLLSSDAFRSAKSSEAYRQMESSEAFRQLKSNDAVRAVLSSDAFRAVLSNDAFRAVLSSDAFRAVLSNDAFRAVLSNDAFRSVMSNDAYRQLHSNDMFRDLSRSQKASEAFMSEAMRAQK